LRDALQPGENPAADPQNEPIRRISGHNTRLPPNCAPSGDTMCSYRHTDVAVWLKSPVRRRFGMISSPTTVLDGTMKVKSYTTANAITHIAPYLRLY
jgi:hypothetical protein